MRVRKCLAPFSVDVSLYGNYARFLGLECSSFFFTIKSKLNTLDEFNTILKDVEFGDKIVYSSRNEEIS